MSQVIQYEGKAKQIITTDDEHIVIQRFKNSATAFNGEKYAEFEGKGKLNNAISSYFFERLEALGLKTHYRGKVNAHDMRVARLTIFPLEVVVRNIAAGSLSKRLGLPEGTALRQPIVETYYKKDELGDPMLADTHIALLELATTEELAQLKAAALKVNSLLLALLNEAGIDLVDFKLEFGKTAEGEILLGDEISPDTCRLWDKGTGRKLDKDVFRRDIADLVETYEEVARRLGIEVE